MPRPGVTVTFDGIKPPAWFPFPPSEGEEDDLPVTEFALDNLTIPDGTPMGVGNPIMVGEVNVKRYKGMYGSVYLCIEEPSGQNIYFQIAHVGAADWTNDYLYQDSVQGPGLVERYYYWEANVLDGGHPAIDDASKVEEDLPLEVFAWSDYPTASGDIIIHKLYMGVLFL